MVIFHQLLKKHEKAIEIVDLPSYKMVMFHSFLYVYQRVNPFKSMAIPGT